MSGESGASCGARSSLRRGEAPPRGGRRPVLLVLAWLGVAATALVAAASIVPGANANLRGCPPRPLQNWSTGSPAKQLVVDPEDGDASFTMRFDDSRNAMALALPLTAYASVTARDNVHVKLAGGYLRSGATTISATDDGLRAVVSVLDPRHLEVCLGIDPRRVVGLRPGRYDGNVTVVRGSDEALATLPVHLMFRAPWWSALAFASAGVLLGLLVKVLSEAAATQKADCCGPWSALKRYGSQLTFPVTLILAVVAGWLVFGQVYGSDPTWGSAAADGTKLFAVCFIAQMSSVEGIDLIRRVAGGASPVPPVSARGA